MQLPSVWENLYAQGMESVWTFAHNDQRPAVRTFLGRLRGGYETILDVGCGDGYYWPLLRPSKIVIIEPNAVLRQRALQVSKRLGADVQMVRDVNSLCGGYGGCGGLDLVVLIHVLLYLNVEELRMLLRWIKGRPLVLVYPDPKRAITVECEEASGMFSSQEKIEMKHALLGKPQRREVVDSHFRVPLNSDVDTLAFLVAHMMLRDGDAVKLMDTARAFVKERVEGWRKQKYFEMPQAQVMEWYGV